MSSLNLQIFNLERKKYEYIETLKRIAWHSGKYACLLSGRDDTIYTRLYPKYMATAISLA